MAGLLDIPGFNPADFAVSEDERRRLLLGNILLGLSAGALNSNRGNQLGAFGSGVLAGVRNGQQALSDAQAAKLDQLKAASGFMDLTTKKQAYMDDQAARDVLTNYKPPSPSLPSMAPTPENAAALAAQPKPGLYEQLNSIADALQAKGLGKQAEAYRVQAEKYAPKYKGTETVMQDGKPVLLQMYENQAPTVMQYQPKPDITMQDLGGRVQAIDRLRTQGGQEFSKTATPGEILSNEMAQKNYGLAAAHLKLAQDKAAQDKGEQFGTPIQITSPDGATQLMIPRKGTNQLVPMVDAAGNAVTKSASIPQKYKDTLYNLNNFGDQLKSYNEALANFSTSTYFSPEKATDLMSKYSSLKMDLKNLYELGALAGPDVQILAEGLTDPSSIKGFAMPQSHFKKQTAILEDRLNNARANLAKAYNQPVHEGNKQLQQNTTATAKAREAIKAGKDPAAVRARLREMGYSDEGL